MKKYKNRHVYFFTFPLKIINLAKHIFFENNIETAELSE